MEAAVLFFTGTAAFAGDGSAADSKIEILKQCRCHFGNCQQTAPLLLFRRTQNQTAEKIAMGLAAEICIIAVWFVGVPAAHPCGFLTERAGEPASSFVVKCRGESGKGANLAEMTNLGLPIPMGFTITTEACTDYT